MEGGGDSEHENVESYWPTEKDCKHTIHKAILIALPGIISCPLFARQSPKSTFNRPIARNTDDHKKRESREPCQT